MSKLEWYRKTTWTENDRDDFFAHLNRSKKENRSQYLKIQAVYLYETNKLQETSVAYELIELAFREENYKFGQVELLNLKARCLNKLGQIHEAEECFTLAIEAIKENPRFTGNIPFSFGFFVIQHNIKRLYGKAILILDEFVDLERELLFPSTLYEYYGIKAIIFNQTLKRKEAKRLAKMAIDASMLTYSGLSRHPDVGLVTDKEDFFYKALTKILK